jgi:hypothetical protein
MENVKSWKKQSREWRQIPIGYTRKQAYKEWFDEDFAKVNEEKNATRKRAIQNNTRGTKNAYKLAQTKERRLFRKKARQLDEEAFIEIERYWSIQDSRKFYKRLNDVRRPFEPLVAMCRAKNGELLTNKNQVLARWKEHFEEHLDEGSKSEQPTRPFDLRDDKVDIDLPRNKRNAKYLKNNKAAGADSIAAELLKNGGLYLVDVLLEVMQQVWTSEKLDRGGIVSIVQEGR